MRARAPRSRGNSAWRKITFTSDDLSKVGELLRETSVIAGEGDPISAHGHYDTQGRPRRIHARYANGWRATLVMRLDGTYSISQAIKLTSRKGDAE